jgi:hypothetical protein
VFRVALGDGVDGALSSALKLVGAGEAVSV